MTLCELRGMVAANMTTRKVISAKELRESGIEIICKEIINRDADIAVYKNGYVLYHVGKHSTVFFVPECSSYSYDSVETASVLEGSFFENEAWYVRLIMEGEDRMTENFRKSDVKQKTCSYSDYETDYLEDMADPSGDFVTELLGKEYVDELMNQLTAQQRTAIYYYYIEGLTQEQIGRMMHISNVSVHRLITRGLASLKTHLSEN